MATRIGIDVRLLRIRRGIGNYVRMLLDEFAAAPSDLHFILYGDRESLRSEIPSSRNFSFRSLGPTVYAAWEQLTLPAMALQDRIDLLHCPANTVPLFWRGRTVVTIHDVIYLLPKTVIPEPTAVAQRAQWLYYRVFVGQAAAATRIITVSEQSRRDLLERYPKAAGRCDVIHEAAGSEFSRSAAGDRAQEGVFLGALGITGPFILALGAVDPRKNTARILEAFARFSSEVGGQFQLVLPGLAAAEALSFREAARALGIDSKVLFPGFVENGVLAQLYGNAAMFVYPSLYEGFGLPVLEAMACGAPVITSAGSALREIAGDAALKIDPSDTGALCDAMVRLVRDAGLAAVLRERGLRRTADFSWRATAEATLDVYRRALAQE